jgi:hypothetical protein
MMSDKQTFNTIIEELKYSQETHRIWRDCDQKYRDENPDIGDSEFHDNMVLTYQTRIDFIKSLQTKVQELEAENEMLKVHQPTLNKIKAEGIEEIDGTKVPVYESDVGLTVLLKDLYEYAEKLREGEE